MKQLKLFFIFISLVSFSLLYSCKDEIYLTEEQYTDNIRWNGSCEEHSLPVNFHDIEKVDIKGEWMLVANKKGANSDAPLQVYVEENNRANNREGAIVVKYRDGTLKNFKVTQEGGDGSRFSNDKRIGVGWGYDCNKYYADTRGVKDQVFNSLKIKNLSSKYPGDLLIEDEDYTTVDGHEYVASSVSELSNGMSINAGVGISLIPAVFSLDIKTRYAASDMTNNNSYFAIKRYNSNIKRRSIGVQNLKALLANREDIFTYGFNYYLEQLKKETNEKRTLELIREFVNVYGNSVVTSSMVGGHIDYNMTVTKSNSISSKDIEVGVTVGLFSILSLSVSVEQEKIYTKIKENSKFTLNVKGGDVTVFGGSFLDGKTDPGMLKEWMDGLNMDNAEMTDCNLIPIWELIPDELTRDKVKSYITKTRIEEESLGLPTPTSLSVEMKVPTFSENGTQVKVAWAAGVPAVEFCHEYIPCISLVGRVTVAYPIKDNHPNYKQGIFVGNDEVKPGYVTWIDGKAIFNQLEESYAPNKLTTLYLDNFEVHPFKWIGKIYTEGTTRDFNVNYLNRSYPVIKIGTEVWFRKDLLAKNLCNKDTVLLVVSDADSRCYYLKDMKDLALLPPVNWDIPTKEHLNSIFKIVPNCDDCFREGRVGLDLNENGGYDKNKKKIENIALMTIKGFCIKFAMLGTYFDEPTIFYAPIRPVRSANFRYYY